MKNFTHYSSRPFDTLPLFCQVNPDLKSDELISKAFTALEIEGLESMVHYVDTRVIAEKKEFNIDDAYYQFFENIALSSEYHAPFKETEKYRFLKSLDSVQFSVVWRIESHIEMLRIRDTVYRNLYNFPQLDIKPFSKYMDYLEAIGKEDSYFQTIRENFENFGGFSVDDAIWFPKNHNAFDFTITKNRLWAAIFILGMEETYEMKLDRYLMR